MTIDFDSSVQSQEAAQLGVLKAFLEWSQSELYVNISSKGAEIPFEFNDAD